MLEKDRSAADSLHEARSMGDEEKRSAGADDLFDPLHALVLELLIPDREHFVDDEDFRFEERRD